MAKCDYGRSVTENATVGLKGDDGLDGTGWQPRTGRINFIGDSRNHIQPESEERHGCVGGGGDGLRPRRNNEAVDVKVEDNQNGAEKSRGGAAGAERLQRM